MTGPDFCARWNVLHQELGTEWGELLEAAYLQRFFQHLEALLGDRFQKIRFLIINQNSRWSRIDPAIRGEDVVLIWLADEAGSIPYDFSSKFRLILKSYWPLRGPVLNMHPFPLCGSSAVLRKESVPFEERRTKVFFSGNLNANRIDFYRQFTRWGRRPSRNLTPFFRKLIMKGINHFLSGRIPSDFSSAFPGSEIRFTKGFQQGHTPGEFAARLADAKIALCPPGFTSNETIRHCEAMSLGCVVISAPLPLNSLYAGSPMVQINQWRELHSTILNLIEKPDRLEAIARSTREWWNHHCSPEALASTAGSLLLEPTS